MSNAEWAKSLLTSTQQLRTHWGTVITSWYGFITVAYSAAWSLLVKAHYDSDFKHPETIAFGLLISSMLLGLWRMYTRMVDNGLVGLYADLIISEGQLGVPAGFGTIAYLSRSVKQLDPHIGMDSKLNYAQKAELIRELVRMRRVGPRSHSGIDLCVTLILLVQLFAFYFLTNPAIHRYETWFAYGGWLFGALLTGRAFLSGQKRPRPTDIESAMTTIMSINAHKIILQAKDFAELKAIPFLREMTVLAFIMNTLRSSQRFMLLTEERRDGPAKTRDTIFGLISTSSYVYEGMETAATILKQIATAVPKPMHGEVAWLINEVKNRNSLFNTTLKKIRNGIAFHFNLQIGDDIFRHAVNSFPPIFEQGSSARIIDSAYTLADDVVTQFFSAYDSSSGTPEEKVVRLVQQLSTYNVKLCEVLDNVIASVISDHAEGFVGKLHITRPTTALPHLIGRS